MAKSQTLVAAESRIAALNTVVDRAGELQQELYARIHALEARIDVATQVYRDQRTHIVELEAKLNTRGVIATSPVIAPIVTRFAKRDGSVWEQTRTGNRTTSHQVLSN